MGVVVHGKRRFSIVLDQMDVSTGGSRRRPGLHRTRCKEKVVPGAVIWHFGRSNTVRLNYVHFQPIKQFMCRKRFIALSARPYCWTRGGSYWSAFHESTSKRSFYRTSYTRYLGGSSRLVFYW